MSRPAPRRCAIYTRKSSDEGLDQAFNSLDAQRDAGEAYITSQAAEGWKAIATRYDDGGFSGGTMERPGLQRLLADVEAGLVDVVVVYKIDRLTRSLADFARIVERFDARGVSFVSVTQAFNTTSSMGRLTLNVLLSFAQFEREVTGERIRDKIAASKARGMWMGGLPPLGYDLPEPGSRKLQVNADEAATVRMIFARYLAIGSVHRLASTLTDEGVVSKAHTARSGRVLGGTPLGRGALFHLLRNRIYLGQIVHKDAVHDGEHDAIVDQGLFEHVQQRLAGSATKRSPDSPRRVDKAMLAGRLFDAQGEPMSPAHSRGRSGRLYRYYVSASLQRGASRGSCLQRVAAPALEQVVTTTLERLLGQPASSDLLRAVHLKAAAIDLVLPRPAARSIAARVSDDETVTLEDDACIVTIPLCLPLRGGRRSIDAGARMQTCPDAILIGALRKAHAMLERDPRGQPIMTTAPASPYERRLLRLAFLAPDIQQAILAGRQPRSLNLEQLIHRGVPLAWSAQRAMLGFSRSANVPVMANWQPDPRD
ncbi:recombinase family protein [Novosphingobium tardum]|uniref:Recombinase family protein n=1 Tax=Novosphingobium tardum TaxID=1538021 RepID=A0ABV8RSU6_9SPHN